MPYLEDNTQTDNEQEKDQTQASGTQQLGSGSGGSFVGGGGTGTQRSPKGKGSGSFTNFRQYIEANKPRVERLGQQISGRIQKRGQDLKSQQQQAREKYFGQESALEKEKARISGAGDKISQTIKAAGTEQQGPLSMEEFTKIRQGQGKQFETPEFAQQKQTEQQFKQRVGNLGTSKGRIQELQRNIGKQTGRYGRGQQSLDNILLARNKNTQRNLLEQGRQASQALGQKTYEQLQQEYQDSIFGVQQQRQNLATQTQKQLEEARTGVKGTIQDRLTQKQTEFDRFAALQDELAGKSKQIGLTASDREALTTGDLNYISEYLKRPDIDPNINIGKQELAAAGIEDLYGTQLYGARPEQFFQLGTNPTAQTVATKDEATRLQALAGLAGEQSIYNPETAGTYTPGTFDRDAFQQAIVSGKKELDQARQIYESSDDYQTYRKYLNEYGQDLSPQEMLQWMNEESQRHREYQFKTDDQGMPVWDANRPRYINQHAFQTVNKAIQQQKAYEKLKQRYAGVFGG